MTRCILVLLALFCASRFYAQSSALHVMLSKGTLPAWVNTPPSKQLALAKAEKKSQGYKLNKAMNEIMAAANEFQYSYLRTGRLLFNDEASVLANEIALKLLRGNFALRHSLKICVSYSSGTNVTACPNGLMIIDLGLFAQLENEDQLAFVISHELAHMKNGDVTTSEQPMQFESITPEIRDYIDYRRERERLADSVGYEMYIEAGYNPTQAIRTLDVMERNWVTTIALPFDPALFTDSLFRYNENIIASLDSCSPGIGESEYYSTTQIEFPARKQQLAEWFKLKSDDADSIQPSARFAALNRLAVYNCGLNALQKGEIAMALYLGFYLHTIDSLNRDESDLLIAKTLYVNAALRGSEREYIGPAVTEKAEYREFFAGLDDKNEDQEREYDERGFAAGVQAFLSQLSGKEDAALSVRWSWPYLQRTKSHRTLAEAIAIYSASLLATDYKIPLATIGRIEVPQYKWVERETVASEENKNQLVKELEDAREQAQKHDISVLPEIDSAISEKKRGKQWVNKPHYEKSGITVCSQLLLLSSDSSFRQFYLRYGNAATSVPLREKPNPLLAKGDSLFLFDADFYWFQQLPAEKELTYNAKKSTSESAKSRAAVHMWGKKQGLHIISLGRPSSDTVTTLLYNGYCIAARNMEESEGYSTERFTYPIVFREEYDSLAVATGVTHGIKDFGLLRRFNNGWSLTYRSTSCLNLSTGNINWIARTMGKGTISSTEHLQRFFKLAKTGAGSRAR